MDPEYRGSYDPDVYQQFPNQSNDHIPTFSQQTLDSSMLSTQHGHQPRSSLDSSNQRQSWSHPHTPTEDWRSSRVGSRSVSIFSGDTSQSGNVYRELEEARRTVLVLQTKCDTLMYVRVFS